MAEPTLADVFGTGATQDINTITIQKSALATVGLTASADNRAEALLTAIILTAQNTLTETNRSQDLTNRHLSITYSGQDLVEQNSTMFLRDAFTILLYKSTTRSDIDPDNY